MADDTMYSENPGASDTSSDTDTEPDENDPNEESENEGDSTFLVSKDNLGGTDPQPGDICTFKVERVHDGEVEFSWVKDDNENKEPSSPEKDAANADLESMATQ